MGWRVGGQAIRPASQSGIVRGYQAQAPKRKLMHSYVDVRDCLLSLPCIATCIPALAHPPGCRPTCPTCVLRTGCMSTSFTTTAMSDPENPSVRCPSSSKSACKREGRKQGVGCSVDQCRQAS